MFPPTASRARAPAPPRPLLSPPPRTLRRPTTRGTPADAACPIAMERADTVLARVGAVTITGCDLALEQVHRSRIGLPDAPPRALFDTRRSLRDAGGERAPDRGPRPRGRSRPRKRPLARRGPARSPTTGPTTPGWSAHSRARHGFHVPRAGATQTARAAERARRPPGHRRARRGTLFEQPLAHSADPLAARDGGDLGWLTRDSDDAPAARERRVRARQRRRPQRAPRRGERKNHGPAGVRVW